MQMKMKMDCLPLHLFCSQYATLFCLRFLFLVFTISISCLPPPSRACPEAFHCGNQTFPLPFGENHSGCGDPTLQLDCDHHVNLTIITIKDYQYYVTHISEVWEDHAITIIAKNHWIPRCNPSSFKNYTRGIGFGTEILTLWEGCSFEGTPVASQLPCNNSWYYEYLTEGLSFGKMCKSHVTLTVTAESLEYFKPDPSYAGLQVVYWKPTEDCERCQSKKGSCAYKTDSEQFYCDSGTKPSRSIILGSAIGSGALVVMGAILLFVYRKRCLSTSSMRPDISNVEKFLQEYVHQMPCRYSYSQLIKMTNKFAHKVGEGGFGVVYKGKLPTGDLVAVKMLDQSRQCENQFMNEIAFIGRIHHVHLVRLMGYCYEENRNALVYEYMANGSLDNFIFAGREKEQILN